MEEVNKTEMAENVECWWTRQRELKNTITCAPRHRSRRPMPRDFEHLSRCLCFSRGGELGIEQCGEREDPHPESEGRDRGAAEVVILNCKSNYQTLTPILELIFYVYVECDCKGIRFVC